MKLFSCSTHLRMKFVLLINLKLLTTANSFLLSEAEHEKKFYNLGARFGSLTLSPQLTTFSHIHVPFHCFYILQVLLKCLKYS